MRSCGGLDVGEIEPFIKLLGPHDRNRMRGTVRGVNHKAVEFDPTVKAERVLGFRFQDRSRASFYRAFDSGVRKINAKLSRDVVAIKVCAIVGEETGKLVRS